MKVYVSPILRWIYKHCSYQNKRTPLVNPVRCTRSEHISATEESPTLIAIAYADPTEGNDIALFSDVKKIFNICDEYAETGVRFLIEQYPFKKYIFKWRSL